jgi:hypothetical protein
MRDDMVPVSRRARTPRTSRRIARPRFGPPSFVAEDPGPPFYAAIWPEDNPVMLAAGLLALLVIVGGSVAPFLLLHIVHGTALDVLRAILAVLVPALLCGCVGTYCRVARERQAMRDADRRWAREQALLPPRFGWSVAAEAKVIKPVRAALTSRAPGVIKGGPVTRRDIQPRTG